MKSVAERVLTRALCEPVALSAAVIGTLNVAAVFGLLHVTNEQLGVLNAALASLLGLLARMLVIPARRHHAQARRPTAQRRPAGSG